MKTPMEFALELGQRFQGPVWAEQIAEILVIRDAEIRQACAAEYQQREADGPTPLNFYRGGQNSREREISELKAIIDEARKLAERWQTDQWIVDTIGNTPRYKICIKELRDVLDRSGARGGSVAASLAPLPDNPPTNTDRSCT